MSSSIKSNLLKLLTLICGLLGLALRYALYAVGTDAEGLLLRWHWAGILLWSLSVVTLAALWLLTRHLRDPEPGDEIFAPSVLGCIGYVLMAASLLTTTIYEAATVSIVGTVSGYAAAAIMLALGILRLFPIRPSALLHSGLCVYFALRMVFQYQNWSSDPQIVDYCFELFACVGLMLSSYHLAAVGAGMGSQRKLWFWSMATIYLCCLTPAGPSSSLPYFPAIAWLLTSLNLPEPLPRHAADAEE